MHTLFIARTIRKDTPIQIFLYNSGSLIFIHLTVYCKLHILFINTCTDCKFSTYTIQYNEWIASYMKYLNEIITIFSLL